MNTSELKLDLKEQSLDRLNNISLSRDIKIVAEGDSWFDYPPQKDIIDYLRKEGFAISKVSKLGDTLENMVYGTEYKIHSRKRTVSNFGKESLNETIASIDKYNPKFVLFSAGGNDVVGEEMVFYLNHKESGEEPFREELFRNQVNGPIKNAIKYFIKEVTKAKEDIQILMDGYDYAIPNGTKVKMFGVPLVGPYILPSMGKKGITNRNEQKDIIKKLVDIFNQMLIELSNEFDNFHHIDLRGMFPNEDQWHNEIHLRRKGFKTVANEYYVRMKNILGYDPLNN